MCSDAKLDVLWIALWFWFGFVVVCFIETVLYSQAWPHTGLELRILPLPLTPPCTLSYPPGRDYNVCAGHHSQHRKQI